MSMPAQKSMTPAEYLAFERASDTKHIFWQGELFAMAGAKEAHVLVSSNTVIALGRRLDDSPCRVYSSDMRVQLPPGDKYVYPDISVVCEEPQFADEELDTLLNPLLIVEVLSESTEAFDRGAKFDGYRQIASFQEYVLISQDDYHVEKFTRGEDGSWLFTEARGEDGAIYLNSIECELPLAEIYRKVSLQNE